MDESVPSLETPLTTSTTVAMDTVNDDLFNSSALRVVVPILIVLGVFILISFALLLHKLIASAVKKRMDPEIGMTEGRTRRRAQPEARMTQVNTVSGLYSSRPPSYNHVMSAIEHEEVLPSYYQVVAGVVNLSFVTDTERNNGHSSISRNGPVVIHVATSQPAPNDITGNTNEVEATRNYENSTSNPNSVETAERPPVTTQLSEISNPPEYQSVAVANGSQPHFRSTMTPIEEPVSIVTHNIDELAESISVPSIVPGNVTINSSTSRDTKHKRKSRREGVIIHNTLL